MLGWEGHLPENVFRENKRVLTFIRCLLSRNQEILLKYLIRSNIDNMFVRKVLLYTFL